MPVIEAQYASILVRTITGISGQKRMSRARSCMDRSADQPALHASHADRSPRDHAYRRSRALVAIGGTVAVRAHGGPSW